MLGSGSSSVTDTWIDVDTVLVNGSVVLRHQELVFPNEQDVLVDARRLARETIERAGIAHRVDIDWRAVEAPD